MKTLLTEVVPKMLERRNPPAPLRRVAIAVLVLEMMMMMMMMSEDLLRRSAIPRKQNKKTHLLFLRMLDRRTCRLLKRVMLFPAICHRPVPMKMMPMRHCHCRTPRLVYQGVAQVPPLLTVVILQLKQATMEIMVLEMMLVELEDLHGPNSAEKKGRQNKKGPRAVACLNKTVWNWILAMRTMMLRRITLIAVASLTKA
eukprot:GSA25T00004564001.1